MKNILPIVMGIVLALIVGQYLISYQRADSIPLGSVAVGNQYQSTTTPQVADATNLCPARSRMASSTTGVLGSVNLIKSGAGDLILYDATTTNNNLRKSIATTSLILADLSASPTVGSYHFDIEFKNGLLVDYSTTGSGVSSSTISYRCEN